MSQNPPERVMPARVPAEFERQECIAFGAGSLIRHYPQVFVQLVRAMMDRVRLAAFVKMDEQEALGRMLLAAAGLPREAVKFIRANTTSIWARDWCPVPVFDEAGRRIFVSFDLSHKRAVKDFDPGRLVADSFGSLLARTDLRIEGGNFLNNGRGVLLTTTAVLNHQSDKGIDSAGIASRLRNYFAANRWVYVPPLFGEPTGHVDIFCTFVGRQTVVVGSCDPDKDPRNAELLDRAADSLAQSTESDGSGRFDVVRIKMPSNEDHFFRSYTNVIYANGLLVVPQFPDIDPEADWEALDLYSSLLPGWEVVGIDCSRLNLRNGALHCITANIPPARWLGSTTGALIATAGGSGVSTGPLMR